MFARLLLTLFAVAALCGAAFAEPKPLPFQIPDYFMERMEKGTLLRRSSSVYGMSINYGIPMEEAELLADQWFGTEFEKIIYDIDPDFYSISVAKPIFYHNHKVNLGVGWAVPFPESLRGKVQCYLSSIEFTDSGDWIFDNRMFVGGVAYIEHPSQGYDGDVKEPESMEDWYEWANFVVQEIDKAYPEFSMKPENRNDFMEVR